MKSAKFIQVADNVLADRGRGLLSVLEDLMPVRFAKGSECAAQAVVRMSSVNASAACEGRFGDLPCLMLPQAAPAPSVRTRIRFADDPLVPWPFRGRTVETHAALDDGAQASLAACGDKVLASTRGDLPIWTVNERGGARTYRTSLCLPHTPEGGDVGGAAAGDQFIQTLPLFQFVRELTDRQRLVEPPLRAAYIIDDPNLHWPRYGFADFRAIAASARQDRYHVAFATIPLDAWCVHRGTASIFRSHTDALSLLVHGNNHAKQELAQDFSPEACDDLLSQAGGRIQQLELKSGLQVCRVMVPPHGACSSRMLARLPRHGFESACISAGSLRAHNAGEAWTTSLGLGPSEMVDGCPVLPRWAFSGTTDIALLTAAYLGQPLVLRGHHQDLKDGIDIFRDFARKINALGQVCWGSLSTLSRLNYRHRVEGRSMQIQPLGIRIEVSVPHGIDELRIDPGGFEWRAAEPGGPSGEMVGHEWIVPLNGRRSFSLVRATGQPARNRHARPNATSTKLILRRVLTEARDRLRVT